MMSGRRLAQHPAVERLIRAALEEDIGSGDVTTLALVSRDAVGEGRIVAREPCVLAGMEIAAEVFRRVDTALTVEPVCADGSPLLAGMAAARVRGPAGPMLTAERTALNVLQRLSGIATLTRRFVERVAGTQAVILDTRKTTPGWRVLEKYAVRCGGGRNHRMGLYDRALVKDNHRALFRRGQTPRLDEAVAAVRARFPDVPIEVEIETEAEFDSALAAGPDWILLDNMDPERLRDFVRRAGGRVKLEASGGITLQNVAAVAASGVQAISLGCLTHSAPAVDLSLEME
jgi:nicotinate-nucleotide pyrophosphorylase (carboxylating)